MQNRLYLGANLNQDSIKDGIALFDYDLKEQATGLDVVTRYSFKNTNLITGESSKASVIKRCKDLHVNLIPKEKIAKVNFLASS